MHGIDTADLDIALREQFPVAFGALREVYRSPADSCYTAAYGQVVVQPRRFAIRHVQGMDDEQPPLAPGQGRLLDSQGAQPLGAGALQEFQVVRSEEHTSEL